MYVNRKVLRYLWQHCSHNQKSENKSNIFSREHETSLVAQMVKRLPTVRETWVRSLGQEDPLEKKMATHSSTLAWKIPWTEERSRLQSTGSQRVRQDWATSLQGTLRLWYTHILWSIIQPKNKLGYTEWYGDMSTVHYVIKQARYRTLLGISPLLIFKAYTHVCRCSPTQGKSLKG